MDALAQARRLIANLLALGPRRLMALATIGLSVFALTGFAATISVARTFEMLYSGLDREDVIGIGSALARGRHRVRRERRRRHRAGCRVGQTAQARMMLAEKGLPHSGSVGNELYDKLGSLGLTSFMQEVTRVRAIEGELARTIQMMRGVKAARVHIVLGDEGSFRRERQPPSASVVMRTDGGDDRTHGRGDPPSRRGGRAGMKAEQVTVLNVDGQLLASGSDTLEAAPEQHARRWRRSVAAAVRE